MINNKTISHKPISQLISIVKQDLRKMSDEGLIDEGVLVKTVMACNDRLGIPIREVRQIAIPVENYKAKLPLDFEKLYYVCALNCHDPIIFQSPNPFDNQVDTDVIYDAELTRDQLGGVQNYMVKVTRLNTTIVYEQDNWVELEIGGEAQHVHVGCPNLHKRGRKRIEIVGDDIIAPFKSGVLYIMYIGAMKDSDGNILFPFHPLITPYYEWACKEKILMDAVFNSDGNYADMLKFAEQKKAEAWVDAFNITYERGFGEYADFQRKRELKWYNDYFKYLK